jgi:release factor glutamine methyltransferase
LRNDPVHENDFAGNVNAVAVGTVGEALAAATDALAAAGVGTPRLDAELLLAEASGRERARLVADSPGAVDATAARRFGAMIRRRVRREPVAYILGRRGFRHLELMVDRRVLIPRPESELLVEVALELRPRRLLDVGTGSGAIALAVADELAEVEVVATDTSVDALAVAWANRARLGVAGRVALEHGSLPATMSGYDLAVANLPYVSDGEWDGLPPEIRRFEPRAAVISGPTGLEAIEALLGALAGGGDRPAALALEVGEGQAGAVSELVRGAGFARVATCRDLAGIERVVLGR